MSVLFETTALVLSWRPYREHDRSYSAFTRDHGKIEFVARGGSKPLAKLTPHLETMAEVRLLLVDGRQYFTVAGTDRLRGFRSVYENLTKTTLVQNAFAFVDLGTRTHELDEDLYDFLMNWLEFIEKIPEITAERAGFLLATFALKFLSHLGYHPELSHCLVCRLAIREGNYRWHALKGGVVCATCFDKDREQWFAARLIDDVTLKLLRFALTQEFTEQLRPHLSGNTLASFHETIESLIIAHFPVIPAVSMREACKHL
ncbi:DNA repair protein RecO [Candidatus Uhrbacteria bacterium RIFCSPHIGHO2_02_FULL_47_44]|uniref:DNA repair protein RecO n=1 Tax=Candidatus Uhrbacteria bacterium RIFCSPLOWO2_02_FULL_48_18 TaxID=1802408 RepID=A0A1F7V7S7_9BACT|nr:MAG: DNA repair protein RecO [Candidatus Uhrbacteria bacterium RIFCSPHIGHO2_02_FULL_47_44]OGL76931.1 MAG: DNA repair protein RecO [Candidatus Uhrbacteria bacterium RIFCSPHIGHO2_12_FULL_47_12]OGL80736.1 MAG: DNA repair protein RecO [Candidatus Uhrbacteria bacterium RIFCSPLOWO2_01_FULL_47_17]OGL86612.1 MAG: DNA repair protein RecO [Candidatus Uhrbacteria bacterium RIFCSPLOWO2_02_FULL_48_18]OGL92891.1 MAG: DNA repair protein RecO [Candidatus Uhrbacteria bacterium RIFCSPLOWO2_12_FULL_47_9]